jgi:hypothetical protein
VVDELVDHVQDEICLVGLGEWTGYRSQLLFESLFGDPAQNGGPFGVGILEDRNGLLSTGGSRR